MESTGFLSAPTAHQYLGIHTCIIFNKYYHMGPVVLAMIEWNVLHNQFSHTNYIVFLLYINM